MCGRFTLRTPAAAWTQRFLPLWSEEELAAAIQEHATAKRYNIAPTQSVSCIHQANGERKRNSSMMRWGLIPSWAKELSIGSRMINARSETASEKNSFRSSFKKRRCLIPADGYYEWMKTSEGKQPYLIEHNEGQVLAMAGLWAENTKASPDGTPITTCSVLTTNANDDTRTIHDRMPVFLNQEAAALWIDSQQSDIESLNALLKPAPKGLLVARPVSTFVNSVKNDSPQCVEPFDPPSQLSLF